MPNPYAQVALTYVRHYRSLGRLWAVVGYALLALFISVVFVLEPVHAGPVFLVFMGTQSMAFVIHIKDQFLDARARLMPNYRRVHATVATAAVLIFVVLFPLSLTLLAGMRSVSLVAAFAVIFSMFFWTSLGKSWATIPFAIFCFAFITETGRAYFKEFFSGRYEPLAYAILLFSLAMIFWGLYRLFRLTEEDPVYQTLQSVGSAKTAASGQYLAAVPFFSEGWKDRLTDRHVARLANHARRASISGWSRICRWQLGISVALIMRTCWVALWMCIIGFAAAHGKTPPLLMFVMFAHFFPLFVIAFIQPVHRPSFEVLLPVDRASYIRQMGISTVLVFLAAWAASWSIAILLITQVFQLSIQLDLCVDLLLISALTYVLLFGITAWIALCQSKAWRIVVLILPVSLQIILLAVALECNAGSLVLTMVFAAAVAAGFGLLITFDAYHRWLVADLD
jgi:hypothetical protein